MKLLSATSEKPLEYILLIHGDAQPQAPDPPAENEAAERRNQKQWSEFLSAARQSGVFSGGSAISRGELIGATDVSPLSERLVGHMRFNTHGKVDGVEVIHQLLKLHPTVINGGTVELCEMPRSG